MIVAWLSVDVHFFYFFHIAEECAEEVILCMSKLYSALECVGGTGKNIQNVKLRAQVLKTVYKFVESSNDTLLLQIARIILAVSNSCVLISCWSVPSVRLHGNKELKLCFLQFQISGKNLLAVCKLVFKVSRCDQNDKLFLEDNILGMYQQQLQLAMLN